MKEQQNGYIYILTNPSFPDYVKIGYADNVEERVAQLNRSECTPFAFRIYATYMVSDRLKDMPLHDIIDQLNPHLRSIDNIDGKKRVREFYAMTPEEAYNLLEGIAKVNGLEANLTLYKMTAKEKAEEQLAEEISAAFNRHHFKDIEFSSSLTGKKYKGTTADDGTLCIIEAESGVEIPNNSKPSKKAIIGQAIIDLGGETTKDDTLYQRYRKLTKLILEA